MRHHLPSLKKTPFWIADAALLTAAGVLAFSGAPGMTLMEAVWVVFCVVLGALLLVAPYYLEFYTQARVHRMEHDEVTWERVRRLDHLIQAFEDAHRELLTLQDGLSKVNGEAAQQILVEMRTRLEGLEVAMRASSQVINGKIDGQARGQQEALEGVQKKLEVLSAETKTVVERCGELNTSVREQAALVAQLSEDHEAMEAQLMEVRLSGSRGEVSRAPALSKGGGSLLSKAFGSAAQEEKGSAISRIIGSESSVEVAEAEEGAEDWALEAMEEEEDETLLELGLKDDEEVVLDEERQEEEDEDLGQTCITVHALIGIGNKPYIRGDAPGLSWDEGVPMDFVEIGKWEWKTMRAQEPFGFEIWLNDKKRAEGDAIEMEPGIAANISPRFPA